MPLAAKETAVAMGQLAIADDPDHALVAIGLGSCIGLALTDPGKGVAGLAHIVLPESGGADGLRFADVAVPALIDAVRRRGARPALTQAWLVGGASMFGAATGILDIGNRNAAAVRELLKTHRVRVAGAETGGGQGRTVRVTDGGRTLTVREAGGQDRPLLAG